MLNRNNFEIAELASKDEERLTLCGILVTPSGTSVTDGHLAVIVSANEDLQPSLFAGAEDIVPADYFSPFILDRESALRIAKSSPKNGDDSSVCPIVDATTENNDRAMVSINDLFRQEIIRARKIEGNYPDISRVIPAREAARFVVKMNPELLLSALKAVNRFCKNREVGCIELSLYGAGQPLRIDADGTGQMLTAVVMPLRFDGEAGDGETAA